MVVDELRNLCRSYSVKLEEFANGHFRLSNHGVSADYWPHSKRRTVFMNGVTTPHCAPFDVIQMIRRGAVTPQHKRGSAGKKAPPKKIGPVRTKGWAKHLDNSEIPWEGEEYVHPSDELRRKAWQLENEATNLRARADAMDEVQA